MTLDGDRHPGVGHLDEDPDRVADVYARAIDEKGWKHAQRELGIRINVDRAPTREELRRMIVDSGLSILTVEFERG